MPAVTGDLCTHDESVHASPLPIPRKVLVLRFCSATDCFLSAEECVTQSLCHDLRIQDECFDSALAAFLNSETVEATNQEMTFQPHQDRVIVLKTRGPQTRVDLLRFA